MPSQIPQKLIKKTAFKIYKKRLKSGITGNQETDWKEATAHLERQRWQVLVWKFICNPLGRFCSSLFLVFRNLFFLIYKFIRWIFWGIKYLFLFFFKTLPQFKLVELLAVPLTLAISGSFVTQRFQEQSRQNEIINNYFKEMEKIIVDEKVDLSQKENEPILSLVQGRTQAVLGNLDNKKKATIVQFLTGLESEEKKLVSLNYLNFSGVDFTGFDLGRFKFHFTNFEKANLEKANLEGADLFSANLYEARLSNAYLEGADLSNAYLSSANLSNADLYEARLFDADLSSANLLGANLSNADLSNADLSNANLLNAVLSNADLSNANLLNADLGNAFLRGANLLNADLSSADLSWANLEGADLYKARLEGADLSWADLSGTKLSAHLSEEQQKQCAVYDPIIVE